MINYCELHMIYTMGGLLPGLINITEDLVIVKRIIPYFLRG